MMRVIGVLMMLLAFGPEVFSQPQFRNAGALLIAETITNRVINPNEDVTVSLSLKNVGNETASNLIATIQEGNGVFDPEPKTQSYGLMAPGEPSVARAFSFTANAPSNTLLNVNLELSDAGRDLGVVSFRFRIGPVTTSVTNGLQITLHDDGPAEPYPSILSISNVVGNIINVSVTLSNINHGYPDDLDILLVSPGGDAVMLMSDACGGNDLVNKTITFTSEAQQPIPESAFPGLRFYRPANYESGDIFTLPAPLGPYASVLSAFNGKSAIGDWKLFVMDDFFADGGDIASGWSLHITTLQPADDTPLLRLLGRTTNNMIRFEVSGRAGHTYGIETSPDMFQAFPFETFVMPVTGSRVFEYPLGLDNRFFRAVSEP